jgi:hypothetical protein
VRPLAVATNVAFIGYGALAALPPVLALHLLLPVNLWRWAQVAGTAAHLARVARLAGRTCSPLRTAAAAGLEHEAAALHVLLSA